MGAEKCMVAEIAAIGQLWPPNVFIRSPLAPKPGDDKMPSKTGKHRRRRKKPYTKGELNYVIDDVVHPWYAEHVGFVLVDEVLHALVEQNPGVVTRKFLRYNLPEIIKRIAEDL